MKNLDFGTIPICATKGGGGGGTDMAMRNSRTF